MKRLACLGIGVAAAVETGLTGLHLYGSEPKVIFGPNQECTLHLVQDENSPPKIVSSCPLSAPPPSPLPPVSPPPALPPATLGGQLHGQPVEFTHFNPTYIASDPPGTVKNTDAAQGTSYNNARSDVPIPPDSRIGVHWKARTSGGTCVGFVRDNVGDTLMTGHGCGTEHWFQPEGTASGILEIHEYHCPSGFTNYMYNSGNVVTSNYADWQWDQDDVMELHYDAGTVSYYRSGLLLAVSAKVNTENDFYIGVSSYSDKADLYEVKYFALPDP